MSKVLYFFGPLVFVSISIPLAFLAVITTTLAFSTLLLRVSFVYCGLALDLLRSWLFVEVVPTSRLNLSSQPPSPILSKSVAVRPSHNNTTMTRPPSDNLMTPQTPRKSGSFASLLESNPNRDFEGVGGWTLSREGQDSAAWLMNSRLQLPTPAKEPGRRHYRSSTGPALSLVRSPVESYEYPGTAAQSSMSPHNYFNFKTGLDARLRSETSPAAKSSASKSQQSVYRSTVSSPGGSQYGHL